GLGRGAGHRQGGRERRLPRFRRAFPACDSTCRAHTRNVRDGTVGGQVVQRPNGCRAGESHYRNSHFRGRSGDAGTGPSRDGGVPMNNFGERIDQLPPEKLDLLIKKIRPGKFGTLSTNSKSANKTRPFRLSEDKNYSLEIAKPGLFDTLELRTCPRKNPGQGEVE